MSWHAGCSSWGSVHFQGRCWDSCNKRREAKTKRRENERDASKTTTYEGEERQVRLHVHAVMLAQWMQVLPLMSVVASSSPHSVPVFFMKIECTWNSCGQRTHYPLSRINLYKTWVADPGCDGINVGWQGYPALTGLQPSFFDVICKFGLVFDHSGQQTSVKCVEALWITKLVRDIWYMYTINHLHLYEFMITCDLEIV